MMELPASPSAVDRSPVRGRPGVDAQLLVELLTVSAAADGLQEDVFRGEEGQLRLEAPEESRAELQRLIEDPVPDRVLTPIAGVVAAIGRLRERGIRLGIVCDSGMMVGRVLRGQLERSGLARHFEAGALAFSDEVGVTKPRPEIFRRALAGLGARPGEAAHIGDLRFTDMAGARALGMRAVRFRGFNDDTGEGPEGDVAIDSYADLEAALGL